MHVFSYIYELCLRLAGHPRALWFLMGDSFCESIFWPIPPDVMLCPMCLARRERAFRYALVTAACSVAGAVCGYYLGYFIYDPWIRDIIELVGYGMQMAAVREWLAEEYGVLMVFAGAFTPIPYKVIAVTAGAVAADSALETGTAGFLGLGYFAAASFSGRGLRFALEAGLIYLGGTRMESGIRRYIDRAGWLCVLALGLYIGWKMIS